MLLRVESTPGVGVCPKLCAPERPPAYSPRLLHTEASEPSPGSSPAPLGGPGAILHPLQPSWGSQSLRTQECQLQGRGQAGRDRRVQMSRRGWPRRPWPVGVAVAPAVGGGVRQGALEEAQGLEALWSSCPCLRPFCQESFFHASQT